MPYFWKDSNKIAVEVSEIVPAFWSSQRTLSNEISRNKDNAFGVKALQNGGGKNRRLIIDFDTLPAQVQQELGDPRKLEHALLYFYRTEAVAVDFYTTFCRPDGAFLNPEEQQRYITNASVLIGLLKLRAQHQAQRIKMGLSLKGLNTFLTAESNGFNEYLAKKELPVHNLPTHPTRFKQALDGFETPLQHNGKEWPYNFMHIIKDIEGKRKENPRVVTDRTLELINGMFANIEHKPTAKEIHDSYAGFLSGYVQVYDETTGEIFDPKEFRELSQSTISRVLAEWENRAATYKARSGDRQKYMGQFKPWHQLDRPKYAGSIISVDDRNPPFKDLDGNRIWFYNCLDVASGCITAFVYGKTKEGIILEFYREIVRNYTQWGVNLPDGLEAESSLNSAYSKTFLQEGYLFQNVRIEANNARGKRVERDNGILRYNKEKKRPGWLARPHAKAEANQPGAAPVPRIPYQTIVENAIEDIYDLNNSKHMDGSRTRWEYFIEMQNPELKPTNWVAILPHLGYHQKSSCNTGYIKLQGRARAIAQDGKICLGANLINVMKVIEGKEVDVYWLDDKEGKVLKALAFYEGRYICEVQEMPRYNRAVIERTDACEAARELQSSYVASVEGFIRSQEKSLRKINVYEPPKPAPVNGFYVPGINNKRFIADVEDAEVIETSDYGRIPAAAPRSWQDAFLK